MEKTQAEGNRLRNFLTSLPVLQPLCQATASKMKPNSLKKNEYLEVDLDEEGTRFIVEAVCYRTLATCGDLYGERLSNHPPSYNARAQWVTRVPEHKQESGGNYGKWILAGTDFTALIVAHQWPEDKIIFLSEEAKNLYRFLIARFLVQTKDALIAASFKVNKEVPKLPDDFIEHPDLPLTPFQAVALAMCLGKEAFALFMEQGTGKTAIVIARMCLEAQWTRQGRFGTPRMMRVLVIAPKQARLNWQNEIDRFTVIGGKVAVTRGDIVRRIKAVADAVREDKDCAFGCLVTSYEAVDTTWDAIGLVPWDLIIMDESHYIKWHRTKRFASALLLREHSARRMILTGTPIANTPMDLWTQFEFMSEGMSGFMNFNNFRSFYGKWAKVESRTSVERLTGLQNMALIQERLARVAFVITKEEADLNLPDKTYNVHEVSMTKRQAEFYKKMQQQIAFEIETEKASGKKMSADHILTRLLRLAQITSGHLKWDNEYDDDGEITSLGEVEQIDKKNPKVEAVLQIVKDKMKDIPNAKTLVWCTFIEDVRVLSERLAKAGINFVSYHRKAVSEGRVADAAEAVDVFNKNPDCKVFIGNPASAGEALNMVGYDWQNPDEHETYCDQEIFFSCNWSAVQRSQAEARAHRRGTRRNVMITDLTVQGTIDEEIRNRVLAKRRMASAIQDVQDILQRVLDAEVEAE